MLNIKTNMEVELFDLKPSYYKPCGDVVPNVYSPEIGWKVKFRVKRFSFYVDGKEVYNVEYRRTKWVVIDKWEWINRMRNSIKNFRHSTSLNLFSNFYNLEEKDILKIYSIGPYFFDREVVYTTRALVIPERFDDEAIIEFDTLKVGFYWIFPEEEGVYNIGVGFIEDKNSKDLLLEYLNRRIKNYKIIDIRGAPISIGEVKVKRNRIGEARGLVFPLSGEGIRPSAISAELAFKALHKGKDINEYLDFNLKDIENRIKIQRILLNLYKNSGIDLRKTLLNMFFRNEVLVDAYLEDKIDINGLLDSITKIRGGDYLIRYFKGYYT